MEPEHKIMEFEQPDEPNHYHIFEGDNHVYVLDDVQEVPPVTMTIEGGTVTLPDGEMLPPEGVKRWRAICTAILTTKEYTEKINAERAEYEAATDAAVCEIDCMVCEMADRLDEMAATADAEPEVEEVPEVNEEPVEQEPESAPEPEQNPEGGEE